MIDPEFEALVQHDRAAISQELGQELSMSQYLRLVLAQRLKNPSTSNPYQDGWIEGYRKGHTTFNERLKPLMSQLAQGQYSEDDE